MHASTHFVHTFYCTFFLFLAHYVAQVVKVEKCLGQAQN